jgi:hypothetical protein
MKIQFTFFYFITIILGALIGCGGNSNIPDQGTNKNNLTSKNHPPVQKNNTTADPKNDVVPTSLYYGVDTNSFAVDTILTYPSYRLLITREKYDENHKKISRNDWDFNRIVIHVTNKENDSLILKKTFEENMFITTYSFKEKATEYVTLSSSGGGSGFTSTIYRLESDKSFHFQPVFSYSELSYYSFSQDGSEILCLHGIWALFNESEDGEIEETHFADHAYNIITINLNESKPTIQDHGSTRNKYPSEDSGTSFNELVNQIYKKEPRLFHNIRLEKYGVQ